MDKDQIPFLSASELSGLIEQREISPVEATEAYLQRIDDLDFKYNAYLTVMRDEARAAAREAEKAIAQGNHLGPMHGVPVAVKDQFWSKGTRSTGGSRFLLDFVPDEDATVIANLKKAGAIVLGKANLTEFAITAFSHRYSTPRNPWDLNMYAGGSSGGSGAATAAFLCATSLGEDTGGSIRFPAINCGLVGLRPSWGLVSRYGVMRGVWTMDTVGPISRTVEDAAITLGAIAGHDPKDPYTWDRPVPDYRRALTGDISGVRVGVIKEQIESDLVEPEVRDVVTEAISELENLGAAVEEVSMPHTRYASLVSGILLSVEPALDHCERVRNRLEVYGHDARILLLAGSVMPASAYLKAQKLRTMIRREFDETMQRFDVLALPTSGKTAQPIQDDFTFTSKESTARLPYLMTRIFNLASATAVSVPCGFSSDGLPVGLQVAGRPGDEATVLKVAHAYEQATPWHTRRPPGV